MTKNRTTHKAQKCCSQCGQPVESGPLWDLVAYLRVTAKGQESSARQCQRAGNNQTAALSRNYYRKQAKSRAESAGKFATWAEELAELLNRDKAKG